MPNQDPNNPEASKPSLPPNSLSDDGNGELYVQVSERAVLLRAFTSFGDPVELGEERATNLGNLLLELATRIRTGSGAANSASTLSPPTPYGAHPEHIFYELRGGSVYVAADQGTVHLRASTPSGGPVELDAGEAIQLGRLILELAKT